MLRAHRSLLQNAKLIAFALPAGAAIQLLAEPTRGNGVSAAILLLGALGLWRGRLFGAALLVVGALVPLVSEPLTPWTASAAFASLGVFALFAPASWRKDAAATVALALSAALLGSGLGLALHKEPGPLPWWLKKIDSSPLPPAQAINVKLALHPTERERVRVTFSNPTATSLELDLPRTDINYAPHFDPLVRLEAFDARGQRLQHIKSFGCGAVYQDLKVEAVTLRPGESMTRDLWLPYRHYPGNVILPRFSHLMLINADEVGEDPKLPPAVQRIHLRAVYDSGQLRRSWRDDLQTKKRPKRWRVRGVSNGISYQDAVARASSSPSR